MRFVMIAAHVVRHSLTRAAVASAFMLAALSACDDPTNPPPGAGDPENISRVTVTLTPTGGGNAQTSVRVDPDGSTLPQPVGAAQGTLALSKNTTYSGTITMLNDIDPNNVINITAEVEAEKDFHQFVYTFEQGAASCTGVSVSNLSLDSNGQPTGLTYTVTVAANAASTTTCNFHVILHHYEGSKTDQSTVVDTDLDLTFPVTIS
jgi:hypothetical protein